MIEQAVTVYLNTVPAVVTAFGGQKVFYTRAPAGAQLPWCTVTNSGGSRKRESTFVTEPRDTLTLYVEHYDQFLGLAAADAVRAALENYRGDMYPERDTHFTCGSIRDLDGFQGSHRFVIQVYVRYRQTTVFPNRVTV